MLKWRILFEQNPLTNKRSQSQWKIRGLPSDVTDKIKAKNEVKIQEDAGTTALIREYDYTNEFNTINLWYAYFHAFSLQTLLWNCQSQKAYPNILCCKHLSIQHLTWCLLSELTFLRSSYYRKSRLSACKWQWFGIFGILRGNDICTGNLPNTWWDLKT